MSRFFVTSLAAKYPAFPAARSRSLFGTNTHLKVKIGLMSLSHKIITRVKAHYQFACYSQARTASKGGYVLRSLEGERAGSA